MNVRKPAKVSTRELIRVFAHVLAGKVGTTEYLEALHGPDGRRDPLRFYAHGHHAHPVDDAVCVHDDAGRVTIGADGSVSPTEVGRAWYDTRVGKKAAPATVAPQFSHQVAA